MPQGTVRLGDVDVTALRDVLTDAPGTLAEWFPGVPEEAWPRVRDRYPDTISEGGGWKYFVHCYLVRLGDRTVLVDTGIGPAGTSISEWLHPPGGALLRELAALGASPESIEVVAITHMHVDHVGGNATEDGPAFPNATYLVQEADWIAYREEEDPEGRASRDRLVRSLRDQGVLELVDGERELAAGVRLVPTPGHTPGSQSVMIERGRRRLLLAGDVANHPVQVEEPEWHSLGDADPAMAAKTRVRWFARAEREGIILATAHFPHPFGRITGGAWEPEQGKPRPTAT